jgi:hypothetical protein
MTTAANSHIHCFCTFNAAGALTCCQCRVRLDASGPPRLRIAPKGVHKP